MKMFKHLLSALLAFSIGIFTNISVLTATHHSTDIPNETTSDENEQPTVIESWQKLISLNWNKLSGNDALNIIGSTIGIIGIYVIIKSLSNNSNPTHHAYNMNYATQEQTYYNQAEQLHQQQTSQLRQALYNELIKPHVIPSFEQYKQEQMQLYQKIMTGTARRFAGPNSSALERQLQPSQTFEIQVAAQYERMVAQVNAMNLERLRMLMECFPNGL